MKKLLALVTAIVFLGTSVAVAHQPVVLLNSDTTAAKGPLLVDGTVSFAIRAAFTKAGLKKAFRAQLKEGDALEVQYLIVDKKPENSLKNANKCVNNSNFFIIISCCAVSFIVGASVGLLIRRIIIKSSIRKRNSQGKLFSFLFLG